MKTFAGATILSALALASPAAAADPVSFSCKASAVTASVAGAATIDPITAGGDGTPCQPGITGLPNIGEAVRLEEIVSAKTAYAAVDAKPSARAGVEDLALVVGGPVLGVGAARSSISGSCAGGTARYETFSEVASISLGGFPLVLDGVLQPITDAVSDGLGALVSVRLNETQDLAGGARVVRAAHIELLALDGSRAPLADIVIAESTLDACAAGPPPGPQICPDGSVYDAARNVCVIAVPGSQTPQNPAGQLTGPGSVVVGPPFSGPGGGTVITLQQARRRFPKSMCVRGGGPRYAIVGTNGKDRLTGTNRRDRMIGRGGADRLDGGRGRDCLDGGKGKDGLSGGQQGDRLDGGRGRDFLNGGAGSDRMWGRAGNDYMNAAYGRDRLKAGKGRDTMNVATAGVPARVHGGKGFDKVRANPGDMKFVHRSVERVIVTKKVRG